jgi:hypothetical protein
VVRYGVSADKPIFLLQEIPEGGENAGCRKKYLDGEKIWGRRQEERRTSISQVMLLLENPQTCTNTFQRLILKPRCSEGEMIDMINPMITWTKGKLPVHIQTISTSTEVFSNLNDTSSRKPVARSKHSLCENTSSIQPEIIMKFRKGQGELISTGWADDANCLDPLHGRIINMHKSSDQVSYNDLGNFTRKTAASLSEQGFFYHYLICASMRTAHQLWSKFSFSWPFHWYHFCPLPISLRT